VYDAADNAFTHVDTFGVTTDGTHWREAFPHLTLGRRGAPAGVR
jgi:hypothetical protein